MNADPNYQSVLTAATYCSNLGQLVLEDDALPALLAVRDVALAEILEIAAIAQIDLDAPHTTPEDRLAAEARLAVTESIVAAMQKAMERYEV